MSELIRYYVLSYETNDGTTKNFEAATQDAAEIALANSYVQDCNSGIVSPEFAPGESPPIFGPESNAVIVEESYSLVASRYEPPPIYEISATYTWHVGNPNETYTGTWIAGYSYNTRIEYRYNGTPPSSQPPPDGPAPPPIRRSLPPPVPAPPPPADPSDGTANAPPLLSYPPTGPAPSGPGGGEATPSPALHEGGSDDDPCKRPFNFSPDQVGFGWTIKSATNVIPLEGGQARYRKDFINPSMTVNASWTVSHQGLKFLYDRVKEAKNKLIAVNLYIDKASVLSNCLAFVLPDTARIAKVDGIHFIFSCNLEVVWRSTQDTNADFTFSKLAVPPDETNYTVTFESTAKRSELGLYGKYAEEVPGSWQTVRAQWSVGKEDADYLFSVNAVHEDSGHVPFLIDLIGPDGLPKECTAVIVPNTFALTSMSGETFNISCTLNVKP